MREADDWTNHSTDLCQWPFLTFVLSISRRKDHLAHLRIPAASRSPTELLGVFHVQKAYVSVCVCGYKVWVLCGKEWVCYVEVLGVCWRCACVGGDRMMDDDKWCSLCIMCLIICMSFTRNRHEMERSVNPTFNRPNEGNESFLERNEDVVVPSYLWFVYNCDLCSFHSLLRSLSFYPPSVRPRECVPLTPIGWWLMINDVCYVWCV